MSSDKTILAIDPGSSKHGMALVRRQSDGKIDLIWRSIARRSEFKLKLEEAYKVRPFQIFVLGDGTKSKEVKEQLTLWHPRINILTVDETDTTVKAREKYWIYHPRKGWRRLLPSTLLSPPVPVDDYAAFVLAERFLSG